MRRIIFYFSVVFFVVIIAWKNKLILQDSSNSFRIMPAIILLGEYDKNFKGDIIKSDAELEEFRKLMKINAVIPDIDFKRFMWVCSPWKIVGYAYFKNSGMISLTPDAYNAIDKKTVYMLCVKKIDVSLNYTAPPENMRELRKIQEQSGILKWEIVSANVENAK